MGNKAYLALYLEAPLQSWGYASKFDRRTTLSHPTRSGIVGLLCAASGIDRTDTEALQQLDEALEITVYTLRYGSRLTDYHTVGGGYNPRREPGKLSRKASGATGATVQTYREYLEDSRFGVLIEGAQEELDTLAHSLDNPVWGLWLGRKSCIPTARICIGVFADENAAHAALAQASGGEWRPLRTIREADSFAEGNDTIMDRPLDFTLHQRRFAPRRITVE